MKHYLEIDYRSGQLYQYSSQEKPGYEAYTSSTGNVSYRNYHKKGVVGKFRSMYLAQEDHGGLETRIMVDNGDDSYMIKIPVANSQGRLDSFLESLLFVIPNLEPGNGYRFYPYAMETERTTQAGKKIVNRGISVKTVELDENGVVVVDVKGDPVIGGKVPRALVYLGKDDVYDPKNPNHIPKLDFQAGLGGKLKPTAVSVAIKKEYLENVLQREVERFDTSNAQQPQEAPTVTPIEVKKVKPNETPNVDSSVPKSRHAVKVTKSTVATIEAEEDDDDLPF